MAKRKHTKNLEAIQRRITVLRYEINERREELAELAVELQNYELSVEVDLRSLKLDLGIVPPALV